MFGFSRSSHRLVSSCFDSVNHCHCHPIIRALNQRTVTSMVQFHYYDDKEYILSANNNNGKKALIIGNLNRERNEKQKSIRLAWPTKGREEKKKKVFSVTWLCLGNGKRLLILSFLSSWESFSLFPAFFHSEQSFKRRRTICSQNNGELSFQNLSGSKKNEIQIKILHIFWSPEKKCIWKCPEIITSRKEKLSFQYLTIMNGK